MEPASQQGRQAEEGMLRPPMGVFEGHMIFRLRIWLPLLLVMNATAFAQENAGKILGTVTDSSGAVVPDAKVVAASPTLPGVLETTSDGAGRFVLANVPIGTYE